MTKKKLPYKKVRIIWVDICSSSQWYDDLADVDKFSYSWCEDKIGRASCRERV